MHVNIFSHICIFQCSYAVCEKTFVQNTEAVENYAKQWRKNLDSSTSFSCFYKKESFNTVIARKKNTKTDVLHCMLWPSLVIIVCGIIFLRLEMKRRGMGFCETSANFPQNRCKSGPSSTYGPSGTYETRNGGSNADVKQTLLLVHNDSGADKVQCSLLKNQGVISTSMPALDRLKTPDYTKLRVPSAGTSTGFIGKDKTIGSSLSVDGLRLHQVKSLEEKLGGNDIQHHLLSAIPKDKFRQDSTKTDGGSSTGSRGSKIMGLETPV